MVNTYNQDSEKVIAQLPDNYYDLALCDPPFGVQYHKYRKERKFKNGKQKRKGYTQKNWDNNIPSELFFHHIFRVSKNQIIFGANYFTQYLPASKGWIVWDKGQRGLDASDGELIFTSFPFVLRIITIHRVYVWNERPIHQSQKPVILYKYLLQKYAGDNDIIIDTHGGSMNSGIACKDFNLDIDIYENDVTMYEKAVNQLNNHKTGFFNEKKIFNLKNY